VDVVFGGAPCQGFSSTILGMPWYTILFVWSWTSRLRTSSSRMFAV
jgi:hypothetical protein